MPQEMSDFEKMVLERLTRIEDHVRHIRYGDGQAYATAMMQEHRDRHRGQDQEQQFRGVPGTNLYVSVTHPPASDQEQPH